MQQFESFAQMQHDAERRVMEMQKRAMAAVESADPPPIIIPHDEEETPTVPPAAPTELPKTGATIPFLPGLNLTDDDTERALLMALLLLIKDHADPQLIFLLLYLMA